MSKNPIYILSVFICSSLLLATIKPALAISDKELVDQFYPKALLDESEKFPRSKKHEFGVAADLDNSGSKNYIVAAYSNNLTNVVRILSKTSSGATLAAESNLPCMVGGLAPKVELIDLDNDHKPEIKVSFYTMRGATADWYFKWTGGALQYFGPSDTNAKGWICTSVTTSSVMDLDGSGRLAIVDGPDHLTPDADDYPGKPIVRQTYVLSGGAYSKGPKMYFYDLFVRKAGVPIQEQNTFTVDDIGRSYLLHIINGEPDGTRRVSSAEIWLNGKLIVTPNRFSKKEKFIDVPITVKESNTLSVTLKSEPDSLIEVIVKTAK